MRRREEKRAFPSSGIVALPLVAALALAGTAVAQDDDTETNGLHGIQQEFAEAFEDIGDYTAEQRDAALEILDATLTRLDAELEKLEERTRSHWSEMSEDAREAMIATQRDMRAKRDEMVEARGELAQGTDTAWDDLMDGLQDSWAELSAAWDDATAALGFDGDAETDAED